MSTSTNGTVGQVLEFRLSGEAYCVSIDYVAEIVDVGDLTSIPNAPEHIKGVMDLRGETTAIIDPKVRFELDGDVGDRIIIFDPTVFEDDRSVGWAVDSVHEVAGDTPVRCRAGGGGAGQALRELEAALDGPFDPESGDTADVGQDTGSGDTASGEPNAATDSGSGTVD